MDITRLSTTDSDFQQQLDALLAWESVSDASVLQTVTAILNDVRQRGDAAVLEYTTRFDRLNAAGMDELTISPARLQEALAKIAHPTPPASE